MNILQGYKLFCTISNSKTLPVAYPGRAYARYVLETSEYKMIAECAMSEIYAFTARNKKNDTIISDNGTIAKLLFAYMQQKTHYK